MGEVGSWFGGRGSEAGGGGVRDETQGDWRSGSSRISTCWEGAVHLCEWRANHLTAAEIAERLGTDPMTVGRGSERARKRMEADRAFGNLVNRILTEEMRNTRARPHPFMTHSRKIIHQSSVTLDLQFLTNAAEPCRLFLHHHQMKKISARFDQH